MSKTLILCEKPSQAQDFTKGLKEKFKKEDGFYESSSYVICYARGHLISLYDPEDYDENLKTWSMDNLPIIPEQFKYKVSKEVKGLFNTISKNLKRNDVKRIIIATDAEREGELIARLILLQSGITYKSGKELFRFWTSGALTPDEIEKSMKNLKPLKDYDRLYYAALARQQADWLIGINATRVATLKAGGSVVSIGRVQTPTLYILAKRFNEISNFIASKYYEIDCIFIKNNSTFKGKMISDDGKIKQFEKEADCKNLYSDFKNKIGKVISIDKNKKAEKPPMLYSLSSIQKDANSKYGIRASDTLSILQSLYDNKYTTYPRSGSEALEESMVSLAEKTVKLLGNNGYDINRCNIQKDNKRVFNNEKLTDHYAIIPTGIKPDKLSKNEQLVYELICNRFIAVFYPPYLYENTEIIIDIEGKKFKVTGNTTIDNGWKDIYGNEDKAEILPEITKDEEINGNVQIAEKETTPPKHYTDGTLISAMENAHNFVKDETLKKMLKDVAGIGTPATQASILEKIISRGYAELKGKNIIITSEGNKLIEKIKDEQVCDPAYTALWEQALDDIAEGKIPNSDNFMKSTKESVVFLVNSIKSKDMSGISKEKKQEKETIGKCPVCDNDIIEFTKGFSCSDKECDFVLWKNKLSFVGIGSISKKMAIDLFKSYNDKGYYELKLKSKTGSQYTKNIKLFKHDKYGWGIEFINN